MVMSGVPSPMVETLRRVRRCRCGTRLRTCCAGRAGTRKRSEALHQMLTIGRPAAHRAGARPGARPYRRTAASPDEIVKPAGRPRNPYEFRISLKTLGICERQTGRRLNFQVVARYQECRGEQLN